MSDFDKNTVVYGLNKNQFEHLDEPTKARFIRLMARIAESSYRRGYTSGSNLRPGPDKSICVIDYSLDLSPLPENFISDYPRPRVDSSSIHTLFLHYPEIDDIGIHDFAYFYHDDIKK